MKHPWANGLLLALIATELASGFLGLVSGSPDRAIFMTAHRFAGFGILVLLLWKGANVLGSLRRRRPDSPRVGSLLLAAVLLTTLALGFIWASVGPFSFTRFSGVSWHIYLGAGLIPILVWHSLYQTRVFPIRRWAERRSFLRLGVCPRNNVLSDMRH